MHARSKSLLSLLAALLVSACSLVGSRSRPDPEAENVFCALEYAPRSSKVPAGPDLLFLAWSSPYQEEAFNLSLPDQLLHAIAAPGRHLAQDLQVQGVTCEEPPWKKGARLPRLPSAKKAIRCTRQGLEEVGFEVTTKWGACQAKIPASDTTPRPIPRVRQTFELPDL